MRFVFALLGVLTFASAQETCESLIEGLKQTLGRTQTLTRTTTMKAGFIELASNTTLVKQTEDGLEIIVLERSGRQPDPSRAPAGFEPQEEGWLGQLDFETLTCEGHTLKINETSYELELAPPKEDSPLRNLRFAFAPVEGAYFLDTLQAQVKPPGISLTANMLVTFSDWLLDVD